MDTMAKWQRELGGFLGIKTMFILEGNIHDVYPIYGTGPDGNSQIQGFDDLNQVILHMGIPCEPVRIIFYDPVLGFYGYDGAEADQEKALQPYFSGYLYEKSAGFKNRPCFRITGKGKVADAQTQMARCHIWMSEIVRRGMTTRVVPAQGGAADPSAQADVPVVFVLNFASRIEQCNPGPTASNEMFINLLAASRDAIQYKGFQSAVIFLVDKYNDIPAWMYLENPKVRTITLTAPDRAVRGQYLKSRAARYPAYAESLSEEKSECSTRLTAQTEGYMCKELGDVVALADRSGLAADNMQTALQLYKYGVQDNPWDQLGDEASKRVHDIIAARVKGQQKAAQTVEAVARRAIQGLSGLTHSDHSSKPRGILFLLGPSGVGKTEMVKSLAEALFYDEKACIRFDMSEYSAEHAAQKLFGAPPGYVGYEGGGQLTNAVKTHPFSILLFDEIEKAHPQIWYQFLQILEDGRMTDSQGTTVYFGETIIVFTSNIGLTRPKQVEVGGYTTYERDRFGNIVNELAVRIENPQQEDTEEFQVQTEALLRNAAYEYFRTIGPEVLNRIGESNIVVFRFITREVAQEICLMQLKNICASVKKQKGVTVDDTAAQPYLLFKAVSVRESGGRGVGNMLESEFLNPLAQFLGEQSTNTCSGTVIATAGPDSERVEFAWSQTTVR